MSGSVGMLASGSYYARILLTSYCYDSLKGLVLLGGGVVGNMGHRAY